VLADVVSLDSPICCLVVFTWAVVTCLVMLIVTLPVFVWFRLLSHMFDAFQCFRWRGVWVAAVHVTLFLVMGVVFDVFQGLFTGSALRHVGDSSVDHTIYCSYQACYSAIYHPALRHCKYNRSLAACVASPCANYLPSSAC